MTHCIVCINQNLISKSNPFSDEHVFPNSIGGSLVIQKLICKTCNDYFGKNIDNHLSNHPLILIKRQELLLPGSSGKIPSVFGDFKDELGRTVKIDKKDNTFTLKIYPCKKNIDENTVHYICGTGAPIKTIGDINLILKRNQKQKLTKESEQYIKDNLTNGYQKSLIAETESQIDLIEYQRCFLKIAYELAFYWIGKKYTHDPIADKLRLSLLHDKMNFSSKEHWSKKRLIEGNIDLYSNLNISRNFCFWDKEENSHIAFLHKKDRRLTCSIRIFKVFCGTICISENANQYDKINNSFIRIDPKTKYKYESTLDKEIFKLSKIQF